ncbi:penicillin-binding protein 2 [Patescibacteria group bacterium]|nr:penicillin-binding protein 2 [Patescibacteria group bacterium]MBU1613204.1 penicillin-binding protein 2 [Patescibacteria group bacterium]
MAKKNIFDISSEDISSAKMSGKFKNNWIEESFNFENEVGRQIPLSTTRKYLGSSVNPTRIKILLAFFVLGILVIFGKIAYLQILNGDLYRSQAEGNRIRVRPIVSERGIIYDVYGKELVQNVPSFSLAIIPQDLPRNAVERTGIIIQVSEMSGVPRDYIENLIKKYKLHSYESLVIKESLDYETALKLYILNADLPGVLIEKGTKRHYANNIEKGENDLWSFSHIMGYLGKLNESDLESLGELGYLPSDYMGKVGVERSYEGVLRGRYGKKKIEVNAAGKEMSVLAEEAPMPGKNIYLTIDLEAQKKLESIVKDNFTLHKNKRGSAIAMDPNDGSILAMVSWPAFDNNDFSGGISMDQYASYITNKNQPLFNRAISGSYPSGSTVKMIIAAAALEEKIITPATTFLSTGGLDVGNHLFRDWKAGGHGYTNVTKALAWSVNTFFYYIGGGYKEYEGLGVNRIYKYMDLFNLGKITGIDLPGENDGFIPTREWKEKNLKEQWYVGDTYNLSIGQGNLLVTPLQVAVWTAAVANGGQVMQPKLVKKIIEPISKQEMVVEPTILSKDFISPANMRTVQGGMRRCVTEGSCQLMQTLSFSSAGKTGTAQWSTGKDEHAWFTSYAPATKPKIVVTVMVEEGGEGAASAEPIARDFLAWWGTKYLK